MFGAEIDGSIILQEPVRLWYALWVLLGFKMIDSLFNLVYWEWQYIGGGDDYMNYGKEYAYWKKKIIEGMVI